MEKDTTTSMKVEVLQVIQEKTVRGNLLMMIKDGENLKEGKEANPMVKGSIEETGVIVGTEEASIMEAAGRGSEDTAGGVSVSEGLL